MFDVCCIGNLVADVIAKPVTELPESGKLGLVDSMSLHSGGCAMNTGNALGCLGIATAVLGKVGDDGFGSFLLNRLNSFGVDTAGVVIDSQVNTSGTMVMLSPDGERTFIHYIGANGEYSFDDVRFDIIASSKILHVAGYYLMPKLDGYPTAQVLKKAQTMGAVTTLDTCWDAQGRWLSLVAPCLPFVDYFVPSLDEAKMITGLTDPEDIAGFLLDKGAKNIVLKLGEQGSYVRTADGGFFIQPFRVEALDATGAGDSFVAGFLAGLTKGWSIQDSARLGNAVGACCVTGIGASSGIKGWEATLEFMGIAG